MLGPLLMLMLQAAQLQYYEALMLQSEKWGWSQAAASFAQAAMRHIQVAYPTSDSPVSDHDRAVWAAQRHERESKLCTNLFVYALDAGCYEVRTTALCLSICLVSSKRVYKGRQRSDQHQV